jgi:hypothetical protein
MQGVVVYPITSISSLLAGEPHRWGLIPLSQITPHLAFEERGTRSGAGAGVLREA